MRRVRGRLGSNQLLLGTALMLLAGFVMAVFETMRDRTTVMVAASTVIMAGSTLLPVVTLRPLAAA